MNVTEVTEIRTRESNGQFAYELWGTTTRTKGVVFIGSDERYYDTEEQAKNEGLKHASDFPTAKS